MRKNQLVLMLCSLAQGLQIMLGRTTFSLLLPLIRTDLELSYNKAGLILSSFFLGYTFMQIPSGLIADKYGSKKIMILSLIGIGVFITLVGMTHNFTFMILLIIAMGFVGGNIYVPSTKVIAYSFSSDRGKAMGILTVASLIGVTIGTAFIPVLGDKYGWKRT